MLNDAHVHFFSPAFFDALGAQKGLRPGEAVATLGWDDPVSPDALADRWATELDRHGVGRAALIASIPGDEASVAAAIRRQPGRFVGFFMLDPTREDAVARTRAALDAGLRGICLFPAMQRYSLHDDRVAAVFDLAASFPASREAASPSEGAKRPSPNAPEGRGLPSRARPDKPEGRGLPSRARPDMPEGRGLPSEARPDVPEGRGLPSGARPVIFVHCGVLSVGVRGRLGLPSPFDMRCGNPLDLHHLAARHPDVPIVIPHFGAGLFREALMLASVCPNVHFDTSSSNGWMRTTPGLTLEQVFRTSLEVLGPDRLLFGSDSSFFPRGWHAAIHQQQQRALGDALVPPDARAKIFGGNFDRLFPPG